MTTHRLIIHTMLRDEDNLVKDFILHNIINIGIDHIYMYDDGSKIPVENHVKKLPDDIQQKVTVIRIDFDILNKDDLIENNFYDDEIFSTCGEYKQRYLQTYFTKLYGDTAEWCFYCDVDEFIYLKDGITIQDVIEKYSNYDSIYIPWLIFGSSYHFSQPEGSVLDTFKFHANNYDNAGKSIVRMSAMKNTPFLTTHHIKKQNSYVIDCFKKPYDPNNDIHICHYNTQSMQMYIKRKIRHEVGNKGGHMISVDGLLFYMVSFNDITQCDMSKYSKKLGLYNKKNDDIVKRKFPLIYSLDGKKFAIYSGESKMYFITTNHISYDDLSDVVNNKNKIIMSYKDELLNQQEFNEFKKLNPAFKVLSDDIILYMYLNSK